MRKPTLLERLGWNRRVLTFADFEDICERQGVLLLDASYRRRPGFYTEHNGWPVIALDQRLHGAKRTLVAWHEFGHYLLHTPGYFGLHSKTELQADVVAHVALIPVPLLHLPDGEICETYGYSWRIVRERVRIFRAFNL